jgi:hypothetical protein
MTPTEYEPKEFLRMSSVEKWACAASILFIAILVGIPLHLARQAGVPISFWLVVALVPLGRVAWQLMRRKMGSEQHYR